MNKVVENKIEHHQAKTYRTDHFSAEQIAYMNEKATDQEKEIARIFFKDKNLLIGPGVLHHKEGFGWPLTSTRRAINNLTQAGILVKTDRTALGIFDKPEHQWKWASEKQSKLISNTPLSHRDILKKQQQIDAGKQPRFQRKG